MPLKTPLFPPNLDEYDIIFVFLNLHGYEIVNKSAIVKHNLANHYNIILIHKITQEVFATKLRTKTPYSFFLVRDSYQTFNHTELNKETLINMLFYKLDLEEKDITKLKKENFYNKFNIKNNIQQKIQPIMLNILKEAKKEENEDFIVNVKELLPVFDEIYEEKLFTQLSLKMQKEFYFIANKNTNQDERIKLAKEFLTKLEFIEKMQQIPDEKIQTRKVINKIKKQLKILNIYETSNLD